MLIIKTLTKEIIPDEIKRDNEDSISSTLAIAVAFFYKIELGKTYQ